MKRMHAMIAITVLCLCVAVFWPAFVQGQRASNPALRAAQAGTKAKNHLARKGLDVARIKARAFDFDDVGTTHVRFEQQIDGVRVFGHELITHEGARGDFQQTSGDMFEGYVPSTAPVIGPSDALQLAVGEFGLHTSAEVELVIYPRDSVGYLAWSVDLKNTDVENNTPQREQIIIDAISGMTIDRWDNLQTSATTGTGYGFYAGTVSSFPIDLTGGTYFMFDVPNNAKTTDFANGTCGFFGCGSRTGTVYSSTDNIFGTTGVLTDRQSIGVDAHYFAQKTLAYWSSTFGRNGIDNNNNKNLKFKYMLSRTHYGTNYNNAFWDGSSMSYGDGDGTTFRPFDAIDVVGHEMMHGVTERTSKLVYRNESGAANESFSDIDGTVVEYVVGTITGYGGVQYPWDWWIGEDLYYSNNPSSPTRGIRNMADPHLEGDPDHYSEKVNTSSDNGGVHTNSGIMNKVFYLLANGGTNHADTTGTVVTGIGILDAGKISFDADTKYCTQNNTYAQIANAWVNAAKNRFGAGSAKSQQTFNAWKACGRTPTVTP
ncbi:MAG: Bacillolysin [Acidobacteria bacterium]|nr:Bacillolysin [Acidobacteriota bacterium]